MAAAEDPPSRHSLVETAFTVESTQTMATSSVSSAPPIASPTSPAPLSPVSPPAPPGRPGSRSMPAPAAANRHVRSQRPGQAELDGRRAATEVRMIFEMRKCRRLTSCSGGRGGVLRHLPAASKPPSAKSDGAAGTRIVGSLGGARCSGGTVQATCARHGGVQVTCACHAVRQRWLQPRT